MANEQARIELTCKYGHVSIHPADTRRVRWCPKCGVDIDTAAAAPEDSAKAKRLPLRSVG
jgi:hypothetical protein